MSDFKCQSCPLRCGSGQDLRRHIMTHTGEKPFKCDLCDRMFARKDNCQKHMRNMHPSDDEHDQKEIEHVERYFHEMSDSTSISKEEIETIHGDVFGPLNLQTSDPEEEEVTTMDSDDYVQTRHPKKNLATKMRFKCHICSKVFPMRRDMQRHVLTHTGEKPFKCNHCDGTFARMDNCKSHMKKVHASEESPTKTMTAESVGAQQQGVGAAPKRSRLSLKNRKGKTPGDQITPKQEPAPKPEPVEETKPDDTFEALNDELRPIVSSCGNLGNTCFLNSVLQVLRYTPGFVPNVSYLSKELLSAHREKLAETEGDGDDVEVSSQWRLVRSLSKLFAKMNKEEEYFDLDSDPYDLVAYPSKLLDIVREMNPMFEGNLQHDAQEMLRCLLCYIQDATNELTKFRSEPYDSTKETTDKSKAVVAEDNVTTTLEINEVGEIGGEVDMSKDSNFNYDLKHSTPTKPEIQMKGGARPRVKTAATITRKRGKTLPEPEKADICDSDSKNGTETIENRSSVHEQNGNCSDSKCGKASESKVGKNCGRGRVRKVTKREMIEVSPKRGRSVLSKNGAKDADVENRPVDENILENLGEQTEISVSVDKEGSITFSPRKDTKVMVSPCKNGLVTLSVERAGSPENSNSSSKSSKTSSLNGGRDDSIGISQAGGDKNRSRKAAKKFVNVFEKFVVEKTESLKYDYVPIEKKMSVATPSWLNRNGGIRNGHASDEDGDVKWSVNRTSKTYSKKTSGADEPPAAECKTCSEETIIEKPSECIPEVMRNGSGDCKSYNFDWLKPIRQSSKKPSSFADAFTNYIQGSNSNSRRSPSPKKQCSAEVPPIVKSEKCLGPLTCEIPLNTSVICPNGVSPKLPASLSPTVELTQLEHVESKHTPKVNLTELFETCDENNQKNSNEKIVTDSQILGNDAQNTTRLKQELQDEPKELNGPDMPEIPGQVEVQVLISPVKLINGLSPNLSPTVELHPIDERILNVSPKRSCTGSLDVQIDSPIPKLKVLRKVVSPSVCHTGSPGKVIVNGNGDGDSSDKLGSPMDTTSPKDLPGNVCSPEKASNNRDCEAKVLRTPEEKNSCVVNDTEGITETQGDGFEGQCSRSNKRLFKSNGNESVAESRAKRQRHGSERVQTNLFSHFERKKRNVRRLGMRGEVVVKGEDDSSATVSPSSVSAINGHQNSPSSASGLLDEELDKPTSIEKVTSKTQQTDSVEYDLISPMQQPFEVVNNVDMTPTKTTPLEEKDLKKARKSLDFSKAVPAPVTEVDNNVNPASEVLEENEPMETILMADLVKDAMNTSRKAVVCLEKCDMAVSRKAGKRLIDSLYEEQKVKVVENMFQGMVVLKTRCLECECCTARKEDFQDVSIPVPSSKKAIAAVEAGKDDVPKEDAEVEAVPSDDEDFPDVTTDDWMLSAMAEVEQLRDENKYYCDQCCRLVEAQRFMQYEMMPDILTFHVKRFAACTSILGGVSKLTDHVATPFSLPCFKASCEKPCQETCHRYSLYGIIMHSGSTISAGHYTAYVKVPSDLSNMNKKAKDQEIPDLYDMPGLIKLDQLTNQWLECDDDIIKSLSEEELQITLSEPDTCATPYVLFYRRDD